MGPRALEKLLQVISLRCFLILGLVFAFAVSFGSFGPNGTLGWGSSGLSQTNTSLASVSQLSGGGYNSLALGSDGTVVGWGLDGGRQLDFSLSNVKISQVGSGMAHTVILRLDGTVAAYGDNSVGQLNVPTNLLGITQISAGGYHTLALRSDGTVMAWGLNTSRQCSVPVGLTGVIQVAAGLKHSMALKSDGSVVVWGDNSYRQLSIPSTVKGITQIGAGAGHCVALKSDGTVVAWGRNDYGQAKVTSRLTGVVQIAVGGLHTVALKSDGTLSSWGNNSFGQTSIPSGMATATQIAAGGFHTLCLQSNGVIAAWGNDDNGQCDVPQGFGNILSLSSGSNFVTAVNADGSLSAWGDDTFGQTEFPYGINNAVQVSSGLSHALCLLTDGTFVGWGDDFDGECDAPDGLTSVIQVAAGSRFSVAVKGDGTVVAWGNNDYGQCNVPAGLSGVKSISAGNGHVVALLSNGTVVCWGANGFGQSIPPVGLTGVIQVAAGGSHSLALLGNGTVVAWGNNSVNQATVPPTLGGVTQISAGWNHSIAVLGDGSVAAWGDNSLGQCNVPYGLAGAGQVSAGAGFNIALKSMSLSVDNSTLSYGGTANVSVFLPVAPTSTVTIPVTTRDVNIVIGTVTVQAGSHLGSTLLTVNQGAQGGTSVLTATYGSTVASTAIQVALSLRSFSLPTQTLLGGATTTGTLTLNGNASRPGVIVTLSSNNPAVVVPNTVTMPPGTSSVTFPVTTSVLVVNTPVILTASALGISLNNTITVKGPTLTSFTVSGISVIGGSSLTGTVTISGAAPTTGYPVLVSSDQGSVTVPSVVTVPAGSTSATFTITTTEVQTDRFCNLSLTANGGIAVGQFKIYAIKLSSFTLSALSVFGGLPLTGTITTTSAPRVDGLYIGLVSSFAGVTVPASVMVPNGTTTVTFPVTCTPVLSDTVVSLTAIVPSSLITANVKVRGLGPQSLTLSSLGVTGGTTTTATYVITGPAPQGGLLVSLSSNQPSILVPTSVSIPSGATSVTFSVSTQPVAVDVQGTVTATANGQSLSVLLKNRAPVLTSISFSPNAVAGGNPTMATVALNGPAPAGGLVVQISSNKTYTLQPATVTIPAGASNISFTIGTTVIASTSSPTITATIGASTVSSSFTVTGR